MREKAARRGGKAFGRIKRKRGEWDGETLEDKDFLLQGHSKKRKKNEGRRGRFQA